MFQCSLSQDAFSLATSPRSDITVIPLPIAFCSGMEEWPCWLQTSILFRFHLQREIRQRVADVFKLISDFLLPEVHLCELLLLLSQDLGPHGSAKSRS